MGNQKSTKLSRREQEIMDIIYQLGEASVHDVVERLSDRPAYDSIRVTMGILKKKQHLDYRRDGRQYIYFPQKPVDDAMRSAARNMMKTFFDGSPSRAVLAFLDVSNESMTAEELAEIERLIEQRKQQ